MTLPRPGLGWALAIALCGARAGAQSDLEAVLSRAVELHQGGDLEGAAALYLQVLREAPGAGLVRSNLGAVYAGLGRYEEAISEYRQALDVQDDASIRQNLSLSLLKAGRLEEAADEAQRVLSAQPGNRNMLLVAADCHSRLGRNEKVVELLRPVVASFPDDKAIAFALGTALLSQGRTDEAQVLMDRVFSDGSPEARVLLGAMLARKGEAAAAKEHYEAALAANPRLPLANFLLAQSLLERSDWAAATEAFRREVEIDPNHFDSNLMLGYLLRKEGRNEEALRYLAHAARLKGSDLGVKFALGATYVALGRLEEGLALLEEVKAAQPEHLPTHMQLAIALTRLGRTDDAARARAEVVRLQREAESRSFQGARDRLDEVLGRLPSLPADAPPPERR